MLRIGPGAQNRLELYDIGLNLILMVFALEDALNKTNCHITKFPFHWLQIADLMIIYLITLIQFYLVEMRIKQV